MREDVEQQHARRVRRRRPPQSGIHRILFKHLICRQNIKSAQIFREYERRMDPVAIWAGRKTFFHFH